MEKLAKKLAIDYSVGKTSDKGTFPLKELNRNFAIIRVAYDLLSESVSKNVPIAPSGEWLLDNFYIIEEQVGSLRRGIELK